MLHSNSDDLQANESQCRANEAAWDEFCDILKRSGRQILREEAPRDALTNSEGYRYLTRLLRIGLEMQMEFADPDFPGFCIPSHETAKIGADNPDNLYLRAPLNDSHCYRVYGNRGTVHYLSFACQKGGYEQDGTLESAGFIDAGDMNFDENGNFELLLCPPGESRPDAGNLLLMEKAASSLIVRQTFHDRKNEIPAKVSIERLDVGEFPKPLTPELMRSQLLYAAHFVEGTSKLFADWAQGWKPQPNTLPLMNPEITRSVGGDANILYYHGYWQLAEDEALVVEVDQVPDCETWNIQINNYWMESLDYRHHRICINKHNADYETKGGIRLILAHRDPSHPNWLHTASHREGTLCFRWVGARDPVAPKCRRVKLQDL